MRKTLHKSILLVAMFAICTQAFAGIVSLPTAQTTAINFYRLASNISDRTVVTATLKFTKTETDGTVDFYVFDISPLKGFVVVSANDQVVPVIAYSMESNFNTDNISHHGISDWINNAGTYIHKAVQRHAPANATISGQWSSYLQGTRPANAKSLAAVAPLLTTKWAQEPYYNKLCPYNSADQMRTLTGCAATAMAQIMKYWNYPATGTGYYAYNCAPPSFTYNYGSQVANFGNTTYNWSAMPDSLSADNLSIATLMYHCGVAVAMNYGDDNQGGSGAFVLSSETSSYKPSVQKAYYTYFSYNANTIRGVKESDYTPDTWLALMKAELSAGRPIQYEGSDPSEGGHTWVCDGYDENGFLHMNWGWGGLDNGYYNISALSADGYNFSTSEAAIIGIEPMSDLAVTASASRATVCAGGTTTLSAQGPANGTYTWSPATGLSCAGCATTQANPLTTTTYTVTVDSAGLSATSQVTVTIGTSHINVTTMNITNASGYGVNDGTARVEVAGGNPAYTYMWNNELTTDSISHLAAGNYKVTITDATGCTASAEANITQPDSLSANDPNTSSGHHALATPANSQIALSNKGGVIYIQKSALVSVQGDLLNTVSDSTGVIQNDGIIEITGNFENDSGASFRTGSNATSTDRAVKFIGNGTQTITGNMSTPGKSSFYNLVVDQANSSDTVEMQTPVVVEGSVVFGTANTTETYNPTSTYTNNNEKGLLKTFDNADNEYLLDIQNGDADAIAGYPVLQMGLAPTTGFILTSGLRGSANGGLQRKIASATSYLYPIGTIDKGFNGLRLNFSQVPGGGSVKAKFCSGSSNPTGYVGTISQYCANCPASNPTPDNNGYNRYFESNECNGGAPQWVVFDNTPENHGYWSLASTNTGYTYDMEVFPNSLGNMDLNNLTRVIKHEASYGTDPSLAAVDWRDEIESATASVGDLLTFTKNAGCYTGAGIPGGTYKDFSHFTIAGSNSDHALPVQLLYLKAESEGKHHVNVSWATALEINNAGFFVMRSTDGVNFVDLGWVQGHNNSTVNQTYNYDDRVQQNTTYYYKLRQVDNNGKFVYSNIAEVRLADQQGSDFALYPNPTANDLFLDVKNPGEEVKVEMYDLKGQVVYSNIFTIVDVGVDQTLTIHASSELTLGTYILTATTNGSRYSAKAILQ